MLIKNTKIHNNSNKTSHNNLFKIFTTPLFELNQIQRFLVRISYLIFKPFIKVENEERLKNTNDILIFAFNHNNSIETIIIATYLLFIRQGKKITFIVDWMYGKIPVIGWIIKQVNPIYVYNKRARIKILDRFKEKIKNSESYQECINRLNHSSSVGIFPEGKRNKNPYKLMRGRKGIGFIVLNSKTPVIPIGIDFPAREKKGRIPRFGSIILRIGKKIDFPEEINAYQKINQTNQLEPYYRKRLLNFLSSKITHRIMIELSCLSGKIYPFHHPENPPLISQYLPS